MERCAECAAFARALDGVLAAAPALVPVGVPAGLEDRVLSRIASAPAASPAGLVTDGPPEVSESARRRAVSIPWGRRPSMGLPALVARFGTDRHRAATTRPFRRSFALAGAAAAALVVAAALVAVAPVGHGGDTTAALHGLLLSDARETAAAGSAELQFSATSAVSLSFPALSIPKAPSVTVPTIPQLPQGSLPACTGVDSAGCQAAAQAEQQFQSQIEQFEQCMSQYEAAASQVTMPTVPTTLSYTFGVDGSGEVAQPNELELSGTVRLLQSHPGTADGPHAYRLIVTGGHAYEQVDGGTWQLVPAPAGVLGPVVLDPGQLLSLMRGAQGPVQDLGTSQMDGVQVRHLRFAAPGSALAGAPAGTGLTIDVWAGVQDHLVRQFDMQATVTSPAVKSGARFSANSSMSLHLSNFGVPVNLTAPSPVSGTLQPQGGPGVFLYPFPNGLTFSVSGVPAPALQGPSPQTVAPHCAVSGTQPQSSAPASPNLGQQTNSPAFPPGGSSTAVSPSSFTGSPPDWQGWQTQPNPPGGSA